MSSSDAWREFRPPDRCPICGHAGRCKYAAGRRVVLCFRVEPGSFRPAQGNVGWLHRLDDAPKADAPAAPPPRTADLAPAELRAEAYRLLLARLSLHRRHRDALRRRGLDDAAIDQAEYRTLTGDEPDRWALGRHLFDRLGDAVFGVPGVVRRRARNGRPYVTVGGRPGLVVPVRDADGQVAGLLTRPDDPGRGGKYQWLHAAGGPANRAACHVPVFNRDDETAVLTEGALKADVIRRLSAERDLPLAPWYVVGLPGVTGVERVVPLLRRRMPSRVLLAFDSDQVHNPVVSVAMARALLLLRRNGFPVGVLAWPQPLGKGLDDVLRDQRHAEIELIHGEELCP